jgi:hypothetical protein
MFTKVPINAPIVPPIRKVIYTHPLIWNGVIFSYLMVYIQIDKGIKGSNYGDNSISFKIS